MTLREFRCAVAGYQANQKQMLRLAAWHAANVMNPHTKAKITPRKLLGSETSYGSREHEESAMREAQALREGNE